VIRRFDAVMFLSSLRVLLSRWQSLPI
jgi:hypothetical protein